LVGRATAGIVNGDAMSTKRDVPGIVLGLVGDVCAGKSAVARRLAEHGAVVYEADAIVRGLYDQPDVQAEVRRLLGDGVFDSSGGVVRSAIAARVFGPAGDAELRQRLTEEIIFPRTRAVLLEQLSKFRAQANGGDVLVLDAPTLFEAGHADACDRILWVTAPMKRRENWAEKRGWPPGEITRRDSAMISQEWKRARADFTIENSGSLAKLRGAVDRVWQAMHGELEKKRGTE
jgi:dephospho-CoA kinase